MTRPVTAAATGRNYNLKLWDAPDTVTVTLEFPKNFMAAYLGTYVSRVDDGGLEFRGDRGTLKIDRPGSPSIATIPHTRRGVTRRNLKFTSDRAVTER